MNYDFRGIEVLEAIRKVPATAEDLSVRPGVLVSLAYRGLVDTDRMQRMPNIYRLSAKGAALLELLNAPLVLQQHDGIIARVQKAVSAHYKVPLAEMTSQRRGRNVARPRQVAMYLCRELSPLSLPCIGRRFNRDHTTVIHAIKTIERLIETDPDMATDIAVLRRNLVA